MTLRLGLANPDPHPDQVLSKRWKSLTDQQRRIGTGLRRPIFVCSCTNAQGEPCDKVFDGGLGLGLAIELGLGSALILTQP